MVRSAIGMMALMLAGACGETVGQTGGNAQPTAARNEVAPASEAAVNALAPPAQPDAAAAEIGRCHMDGCSWYIVQTRTLVRRAAPGSLYRLSLLGGSSGHPDGNYPDNARGTRIEWERTPHDVFVFCSPRLPAVMIREEGGAWQTDVLDLAEAPYGYLESATNIYMSVCHPGEDWASPGFAARFGYQARDDTPELNLTGPEEIFDHAR